MKDCIVRVAQSLSAEIRPVYAFYYKPKLEPGHFYSKSWSRNFGKSFAAHLNDRNIVIFKTKVDDRMDFSTIGADKLPEGITINDFKPYSNMVTRDGFRYSLNVEYRFRVVGWLRMYKMILSLTNPAVEKVNKLPKETIVEFVSVHRENLHGSWYAVDIAETMK